MDVVARVRRRAAIRGGWRWAAIAALIIGACVTVALLYSVTDRPPVAGKVAAPGRTTTPRATTPVPQPPPFLIQPIAPSTAFEINAGIPISDRANPAARAISFAGRSPEDRNRALSCLTSAIYYEAASEPGDGQRAVAQVVLNRVRNPAFPSTVCGVIFQGWQRTTGCQFTFTCDGSLRRRPDPAGWRRAGAVALEALAGRIFAPVGLSTHYHTHWVVPYWASSLSKAAVVGAHIFYRWTGWWGEPGAFRTAASGAEPDIALALLASRDETPTDPQAAASTLAGGTLTGPAAIPVRPAADDERAVPLADRAAGTLIPRTPEPAAAPRAELRSSPLAKAVSCPGSRSSGRANQPAQPFQPDRNRAC